MVKAAARKLARCARGFGRRTPDAQAGRAGRKAKPRAGAAIRGIEAGSKPTFG
jgi:hypothetical protein